MDPCRQPTVLIKNKSSTSWSIPRFNTLRPRLNGSYFADDIIKCIFLDDFDSNFIEFVPTRPIGHKPSLVQIMAWPAMPTSHYLRQWWLNLLEHFYVNLSPWVNIIAVLYPCAANLLPCLLTQWSPLFYRRHIQTNFLVWKVLCLNSDFTGICFQGSN